MCKKKGHVPERCFQNKNRWTNSRKVDVLTPQLREEEDSDGELYVHAIGSENGNKNSWYEEILINGNVINTKLDTGAECNVLDVNTVRKCNLVLEKSPYKFLVAYSQHKMKVLGKVTSECIIKKQPRAVEFQVVARETNM